MFVGKLLSTIVLDDACIVESEHAVGVDKESVTGNILIGLTMCVSNSFSVRFHLIMFLSKSIKTFDESMFISLVQTLKCFDT